MPSPLTNSPCTRTSFPPHTPINHLFPRRFSLPLLPPPLFSSEPPPNQRGQQQPAGSGAMQGVCMRQGFGSIGKQGPGARGSPAARKSLNPPYPPLSCPLPLSLSPVVSPSPTSHTFPLFVPLFLSQVSDSADMASLKEVLTSPEAKAFKVLEVTPDALEALHGAWKTFDAEQLDRFQKRLQYGTGTICCLEVDSKGGGQGWVWYDFEADQPGHVDRFGRKHGDAGFDFFRGEGKVPVIAFIP
jgi:hypothetical protein